MFHYMKIIFYFSYHYIAVYVIVHSLPFSPEIIKVIKSGLIWSNSVQIYPRSSVQLKSQNSSLSDLLLILTCFSVYYSIIHLFPFVRWFPIVIAEAFVFENGRVAVWTWCSLSGFLYFFISGLQIFFSPDTSRPYSSKNWQPRHREDRYL